MKNDILEEYLRSIKSSPVLHVNMIPDKNLVLRILRAYRQSCDYRWTDSATGGEPKDIVFKLMNKHQEQRAKLFDNAIMILEANQAILDKLGKEDIPFSKDEDLEWLLESKIAKMIKSCKKCPYINGCQDGCTLQKEKVKPIPDVNSIPDWCPFKAKAMQYDIYAT